MGSEMCIRDRSSWRSPNVSEWKRDVSLRPQPRRGQVLVQCALAFPRDEPLNLQARNTKASNERYSSYHTHFCSPFRSLAMPYRLRFAILLAESLFTGERPVHPFPRFLIVLATPIRRH